MNTESGAHAVRPINVFPLHVSAAPAIINCAAFSTGIIGTGLAFALYAILKGGRHEHNPYNAFTPLNVHWLEYPEAAYVPPVMDLFVDDQVPFGVSPLFSCPKDTEHLERAFDSLRYRHMSGKLGVPSVVNEDTTAVLPLRILGNASSSFEFLSAVNLPPGSSTQGGGQKVNGGSTSSMGGEKYTNGKSSFPKLGYLMAMSSTRLLFVSGEYYYQREPVTGWSTSISVASLIAAITVVTLLGKRGQSHYQCSSEPSTAVEKLGDVQEADPTGDNDCAPVLSSQLISINPEQLFNAGPLIDSSTPDSVLEVFDNDLHVRSDVGFSEEGSAPVDFAARLDALQDAPVSGTRSSDATPTIGIANVAIPDVEIQTQKIEPFASGSICSNGNAGNDTPIIHLTKVDEESWQAQPSSSTSASASLLGQTVETFLAPIFDEEKPEVEGDNGGGGGGPWTVFNRRQRERYGKGKADAVPEGAVQASNGEVGTEVSSTSITLREGEPLRKRGSRGHGRGRGSRRSPKAEAGGKISKTSR